MKCWFFVVLIFVAFVKAQQEYDYWDKNDQNDDYDNYYDYDNLKELDEKLSDHLGEFQDLAEDKDTKVDVPKVDADNKEILASKEIADSIYDYQFEDNRESKEGVDNEKQEENVADEAEVKEDPIAAAENKEDDYVLLRGDDNIAPEDYEEQDDDKKEKSEEQENIDQIVGDTKNILDETNDFDEDPKGEPSKEIVEETKQILENDKDGFEPEVKNDGAENQEEIDKILEETKKILEETNDSFDDKKDGNEPNEEIIEEAKNILENDDDEFEVKEDAKTDKQGDIPKIEDIFEDTKDKEAIDLVDENAEIPNDEISIKVSDDEENQDQVKEEEDTVDKVQEDLKKDLDKLISTMKKLTENDSEGDKVENAENDKTQDNFLEDTNDFDNNNMEGSEEANHQIDHDKIDKILDEIIARDGDIGSVELDALLNDELNEPNPDDTIVEDVETIPKETQPHPIEYLNDALVDEEKDKETVEDNVSESKDASIETVNIKDLNNKQLEELTAQFVMAHADEINLNAPKLEEDSAPVHITLRLDEPTIITSPNYDGPYPLNNMVEWILEGDGMGIEMNVTDLAIDSFAGHYLLIKPGSIDDSSHSGLLFAYRLNSPRQYRFFDVDRMFIRFDTTTRENHEGDMPIKGFKMSLKMIAPRPQRELIPDPEPVTLEPNITARVTLALPIPQFNAVKEDFRLIIAEMITSYLAQEELETAMDVDETTKIIHVTSCPLHWPDTERCTAVTFGVNLDVDIDLMEMWIQYNGVEPWVSALDKLGIRNMLPPNMSMMTVWLVIASGVVISMAMLAFVLWRFSCFDDYTRMKNYSDTDSIISEKRDLDLYPTPHQPLPPLYHDEYQMGHEATVDMSGFENRSYVRETMYDFESDEEVVSPRDRNTGITPRDYTRLA